MLFRTRVLFALIFLLPILGATQTPSVPVANSNSVYQQLRNVAIGTEAVSVTDVRFKRDIGLFIFKTGTIYFLSPVNGKVTGAVFVGEGSFVLEPSNGGERRNISLLSKGETAIRDDFSTAVLRFTDNSYEELKKLGSAAPGANSGNAAGALSSIQDTLRKNRTIRYNLCAHMLADVLSTEPVNGMFYAFLNGKRISNKELFIVDPQGVTMFNVQPEEVAFVTYDESGANTAQSAYVPTIWYSAHLNSELEGGTARGTQFNSTFDIQAQKIDAAIGKNAVLNGTAVTTLKSMRPGLRAVSFNLFRNFKIQSVRDETGQPLEYIFEEGGSYSTSDRDDPDNFTVILPKALNTGEQFTVKTVYGGKEAISSEGGGNYFPVARDDWFPANRMGDAADFETTFAIPKGMKIAATGTLVSENTDGDRNVTVWRSEAPMWVAGFNFGRFKMVEAKLPSGTTVQSYANEEPPDWVKGLLQDVSGVLPTRAESRPIEQVALGNMNTTGLMKRPLAEGQEAIGIYTDYFGPAPYKRVQITQQTACTFGQAWPGLVWLPICSFFDTTVRHQLGLDDTAQSYWDTVTPHEVAHQWWGHAVAWNSYRDQWMSEGFSEFSASLFTQAVYAKEPGKYLKFWADRQRNLQLKNQFNFRYSEVGALNMGLRLDNRRSGFGTYSRYVYPKGAFVLHMLRMMMYDTRTGDEAFKGMMRDFVKTYANRAASTEDFKAIVEKHMVGGMDMENNQKMDWFFNEWVYGTEIPKYTFSYDMQESPTDGWVVSLKLVQDGVSPTFMMPVPVYCELANGRIVKLGSFSSKGVSTSENKVPLGKGPKPKRFMINYYYDVLTQVQ